MHDLACQVVLPAEIVSQDVMVKDPVSRGVTVGGTTLGGTWSIKKAREMRSEAELRDEVNGAALPDEEVNSTVSIVSIVRWNDRICNYVL